MTIRQKDEKTKRQKDEKAKRQRTKREFYIVTSGQFRTIVIFYIWAQIHVCIMDQVIRYTFSLGPNPKRPSWNSISDNLHPRGGYYAFLALP